MENFFKENEQDEIKKFEFIKTREEIDAIDFANKISNQIILTCGIDANNFSEEKIHILSSELKKKITNSNGAGRADHIRNAIFLNVEKVRNKGNLRFANIVFHEMLHIKSRATFKIKGETITLKSRGLEVLPTQDDDIFSGGLNEAIVSHYERYFILEALKSDLFKTEKEWLDSNEAKEIKKRISQEKNVSEEEIYIINKNGSFDTYGYPDHELVLEKITDKIWLDNPNKFKSREDVIMEFFKNMINGDLFSVSWLVKNSFGTKGFEVLKYMTEKRESAMETLIFFKK